MVAPPGPRYSGQVGQEDQPLRPGRDLRHLRLDRRPVAGARPLRVAETAARPAHGVATGVQDREGDPARPGARTGWRRPPRPPAPRRSRRRCSRCRPRRSRAPAPPPRRRAARPGSRRRRHHRKPLRQAGRRRGPRGDAADRRGGRTDSGSFAGRSPALRSGRRPSHRSPPPGPRRPTPPTDRSRRRRRGAGDEVLRRQEHRRAGVEVRRLLHSARRS